MDVHAEEQDLEELLGRKKEGADGEEPTSYAYAPHFPTKRTEGWNMYIGDQKIDRVFIQPTRFTEIGHSGRIRTLKVSQQAPHNPGLYSFQLFVRSDCYIGCDVRKDMKVFCLRCFECMMSVNLWTYFQLKVESFDALKVSEQANEDVCVSRSYLFDKYTAFNSQFPGNIRSRRRQSCWTDGCDARSKRQADR